MFTAQGGGLLLIMDKNEIKAVESEVSRKMFELKKSLNEHYDLLSSYPHPDEDVVDNNCILRREVANFFDVFKKNRKKGGYRTDILSKEFLHRIGLYRDAFRFAEENSLFGIPVIECLKKIIELGELNYAMTIIPYVFLDRMDVFRYALYAVEEVLPIWRAYYQGDTRIMNAVENVKKWVENPDGEGLYHAAAGSCNSVLSAMKNAESVCAAKNTAFNVANNEDIMGMFPPDNVHTVVVFSADKDVAHAALGVAEAVYRICTISDDNNVVAGAVRYAADALKSFKDTDTAYAMTKRALLYGIKLMTEE